MKKIWRFPCGIFWIMVSLKEFLVKADMFSALARSLVNWHPFPEAIEAVVGGHQMVEASAILVAKKNGIIPYFHDNFDYHQISPDIVSISRYLKWVSHGFHQW